MHPVYFEPGATEAPLPITFVTAMTWSAIREQLPSHERAFAEASDFEPKPGRSCLLPNADGSAAGVLFGLAEENDAKADPFVVGQLPDVLPAGAYRFANPPHDPWLAAMAFALAQYRFERYRSANGKTATLEVPDGVDGADLSRIVEGVFLARDLINIPANDMGPDGLEAAARNLAGRHGAAIRVVVGDDLVRGNFPLIHAVGRAAVRPPRLIDLTFGDANAPKVTLVGKGVCFDTGGLDIKPSNAMLHMKKDMGGAACVLGLAHMLMDRRLDIRLRVLIPAVENSISGAAFRPRDVYPSRKGLTVEIGNTDAEGRLVLADALTYADDENPDVMIDMATLTGAARVALGADLSAMFTDDDDSAIEVAAHGLAQNDPVWRLPLWSPYDKQLDSKVADLNNVSSGPFAGAVTAALFLRRFVANAACYMHFDIFAWTPTAKPARPEGAECQVARALYSHLCARFG